MALKSKEIYDIYTIYMAYTYSDRVQQVVDTVRFCFL